MAEGYRKRLTEIKDLIAYKTRQIDAFSDRTNPEILEMEIAQLREERKALLMQHDPAKSKRELTHRLSLIVKETHRLQHPIKDPERFRSEDIEGIQQRHQAQIAKAEAVIEELRNDLSELGMQAEEIEGIIEKARANMEK